MTEKAAEIAEIDTETLTKSRTADACEARRALILSLLRDFSESDIAKHLSITRQAVNKAKNSGCRGDSYLARLLRNELEKERKRLLNERETNLCE